MNRAVFVSACAGLLFWGAGHAKADFVLTGTVRDFHMHPVAPASGDNPDFENTIADDRGIVTSTLGADGKPVYGSHPFSGTVTTHFLGSNSAQFYFDQWYRDTPGYNINIPYSLTFAPIGGGLFQYNNAGFFPIDNQGFGNEGQSHNYSFTFELHTVFGYNGSGTFSFAGDDDVFVYINNSLVIDLGGVHGTESATVNLATLGLTAGQNYDLDVFFAERHTSGSDIQITTDLGLQQTISAPEPASLSLASLGLLGMFGYSRLRRKPKASLPGSSAAP
jgi:fibro-slime domain-containing protein